MLSNEDKKEIEIICKRWIESFIIGLNLCPFAKTPYNSGKVRLSIADATAIADRIDFFQKEIKFLQNNKQTDTTLMIVPSLENNVKEFYQLFAFCESYTELLSDREFQLVSFHPMARFEGIDPSDSRNTTIMGPFPIVHILRTKQVNELGVKIKNDVQEQNDKKLRSMTNKELGELWNEIYK